MVLFSLILVFALFLFLRGWKAESVVLFFFFLTDGFGLVPNAFKGEQSLDVYANIYMLAAFVITLFQRKPSGGVPVRYVKITYAVFFAFFLLILWVNRTIYDVPRYSDYSQELSAFAFVCRILDIYESGGGFVASESVLYHPLSECRIYCSGLHGYSSAHRSDRRIYGFRHRAV